MGNKHISQLDNGDIIKTREGDLLYVQDKIKNSEGHVDRLVIFPIIGDDPNIDENTPGFITTRREFIRDKRDHIIYPEELGISFIACATYDRFDHNETVDFVGSTERGVVEQINQKFQEMGGQSQLRISSLIPHDSQKIRGMRWDRFTGGTVIGEIYVPPLPEDLADVEAEQNPVPAPPRPATPTTRVKRDVKSLSSEVDMYLAHAVEEGFIGFQTYNILRSFTGDNEVLTLSEAFALATRSDISFSHEITTPSWEEAYPEKVEYSDDGTPETIEDLEERFDNDPVIAVADAISIDEAFEEGFISEEFIRELTNPNQISDLRCETLGDLITHLTTDPEALRLIVYPRDDGTLPLAEEQRSLRSERRNKILVQMKSAYNTLAERMSSTSEMSNETVMREIIDAQTKMKDNWENLMGLGKIFMRPVLSERYIKGLNEQAIERIAKIREVGRALPEPTPPA